MKKSLLALAVLGAFAGVASAQSSVTLFGVVDVNGRYIKNDGSAKRMSLSTDGINSSRLGFRGVEDLGGGTRASFWLEAGINPDTGTTNTQLFNRRSTVSLLNTAGEIRLGRDYVPTFWNFTIFDAFGTNGLGDSLNHRQLYNGTRSSNSIGYFLPPNIGGFYGQAMVAAAEGGSNVDRPARYLGARVGFAAGPFDVAFAYSTERWAVPGAVPSAHSGGASYAIAQGSSLKTWNLGGAYDFGFLKLLGWYDHESMPNFSEKAFSISAVIPMGQGEVHVGYGRSKLDTVVDKSVDDLKASYVYNLSKRTAMYGTVARLKNKDATQISLGAVGSSLTALPTLNGKSQGFELGVRHTF